MRYGDFLSACEREKIVEHPSSLPDAVLVSVLVQTYQHADYIDDCLAGIVGQKTDFPIEVLVGEDASTDGTREICLKYAEEYPEKIRLYLHSRKNNISINGKPTGRFNNLNNLFSARGEFIALCEGDDYWTDPLKLQKQIDFLRANPEFVICAHRPMVLEDGAEEPFPLRGSRPEVSGFEDLAQNGNYLHTPTVVFRNRFRDEGIPEYFIDTEILDWPLHLYNAQHGKIRYLDEPMAVYRKHSGGMWSGRGFSEHADGMIKVADAVRHHYPQEFAEYFERYKAKLLSEKCFRQFEARRYGEFGKDFRSLKDLMGLLAPRTRSALRLRKVLARVPFAANAYGRFFRGSVGPAGSSPASTS